MLQNSRILVTGANGGIGLSISEILFKNHARLVLFYHKNKSGIDELLKKTKADDKLIEIHQVDLLNSQNLSDKISSVMSSGPVNAVIHCVSLPLELKTVADLKWEDFQSHIDIQVKTLFDIVRSLLPSMKSNGGGKIINVLTSGVIGKPPSRMGQYIVGKYALLGLSKVLASELGQYHITVNCVSPSIVNTPLVTKLPAKLKEISAAQAPYGKLAEPNDVASVVLFLCSRYSDYISGENIIVSAGQTMD